MCLVLSLLVIRKVVKAAGFPLGPIVTLSYKNHALDEFLCDILEFDSDLKQPGKLIRAGNTDNINLSGCSESRSREEKKAIQDLNVILEYHKTVRTVCKDWKRCAQHFNTLSCLPEVSGQLFLIFFLMLRSPYAVAYIVLEGCPAASGVETRNSPGLSGIFCV